MEGIVGRGGDNAVRASTGKLRSLSAAKPYRHFCRAHPAISFRSGISFRSRISFRSELSEPI